MKNSRRRHFHLPSPVSTLPMLPFCSWTSSSRINLTGCPRPELTNPRTSSQGRQRRKGGEYYFALNSSPPLFLTAETRNTADTRGSQSRMHMVSQCPPREQRLKGLGDKRVEFSMLVSQEESDQLKPETLHL